MHLGQLVIEVTRRCNATCEHCLRGDPQDVDIKPYILENILVGVTSIGTITFTGGEPTLAMKSINYFIEALHGKVPVDNFYVITNGKLGSIELVHALIDLRALCMESGNYEAEISSLIISGDQYHQDCIGDTSKARELYSALTFFRPHKYQSRIQGQALINEGRAVNINSSHLGSGRDAYIEPVVLGLNADGTIHYVEGTVYVNALGDVIPSCDLSYESQKEQKIGNVNDMDLQTILIEYSNKISKE